MDVERSTLVELDHPWYQGVTLYTTSSGAAHNSKSYQRYLDCLDLENCILNLRVLRGGGVKRHNEYWSVRYQGNAAINRYTSCNVPAALNQPRQFWSFLINLNRVQCFLVDFPSY